MDDSAFVLRAPESAVDALEEVWLLGQPQLKDYLSFVRRSVIGGADIEPRLLADEWREANDYYYELEVSEAGDCDRIECRELPAELEPLAEALREDSRFQRTGRALPTSFAMVELDRLVVSQPHVTRQHVEALKARLGSSPTPEALFRFCLGVGREEAPVEVRKAGPDRYMFWSSSSDFRFQEAVLLDPDRVAGYSAYGPVGGMLGLAVGYGSNFLSVIRSDNRILLHNGYHRACALRELGVTHAPCVLRTVTRRDELNLIAGEEVAAAPAFYFKSARPPLLRDFFNPRIRKILPVRRTKRVVEISFEVREFEMDE